MIEIKNKVECCGCQVCGDICPKAAISFHTDEEGIWYPKVNVDSCIDCHLCEKVCPILNQICILDNSDNPVTYILQASSPMDRLNSASGAAYTLLIREVFKKGGYIAGHVWESKTSVKGYISSNPEDLFILQSTKYLQSNIEGMYKAVKDLLNQGKFVLFSGCPCQNAAMRSFLKKEYNNLLMTDFTCMGIDSPLAFGKYIESLENLFNSKIVYFKAKSKEVGWRYLTNKAVFENGKTYFGINGKDANLKATFLDILVRPSCYDCKYKGFPRISDITIGDYWRRKYNYDPLDDNTGTSYIMLHNNKAIRFFENVKPLCNYREIEFGEILKANKFALHSLPQPKFDRSEFYRRLHQEDFNSLINEYYYKYHSLNSIKNKYKRMLKIIMASAYFNRKHPVSFFHFLYYNFISKNIKTNIVNGDFIIPRNVHLKKNRSSIIEVKGLCVIDGGRAKINITLDNNSSLHLDSNIINSGTDIIVGKDASLKIGYKTLIKDDVRIHAMKKIDIGDFSLIDRGTVVDNSDSGIILFLDNNIIDKSIAIGTHSLIGKGSVIHSGTFLGDETIVNEYGVVNSGVYPSLSVLSGVPAQIVDKDIKWKYNFENIWNYKN